MGGRVMILSLSAGVGHRRAAAAVGEALVGLYPRTTVQVLDTFRGVSPFLQKTVVGLYLEVVRVTPRVYGYLYRRSEGGQLSGRSRIEFTRVLNRFMARRLARLIETEDPAVVICTHPFPLAVLDYLKRKGRLRAPVAAVLTDFTVHPFWVFPSVDLYLVGEESLVPSLVSRGIASTKVAVTGIPIDPAFGGPLDGAAERTRLGLDAGRPTVLVMGGGLGMGPLEEVVYALGRIGTPIQLLVVAGNNTVLKGRLERLAPSLMHPCLVFGFVEEIHRVMGAADLMVGKAGGLSCAEALAVGLPMLIIDPIPGQEERNADFLVDHGVALRLDSASQVAGIVETCLAPGEKLTAMVAAARRLARPAAAARAAAVIGALADL